MAGQVLKVLLTSRILDCTFLLEDLEEVSIAGIIPSQLVRERLTKFGLTISEEKSRMRENLKFGSVRGLIVTSEPILQ